VLELAARAGHQVLLVVTDGVPPDLDRVRVTLSANPQLRIVLIALADSARAADPADRPVSASAWREELGALDDVHPALTAVSVPPRQRLTSERAGHLARTVADLEGAA